MTTPPENPLTPTTEHPVAAGLLDGPVLSGSALEALTRSELDVQIATARRYPRSLAHFKARVLGMIRLDADTARSCYYTLPRRQRQDDGSVKRITISGPSIRLAEMVASAWGNIRAGAHIVAETREEVTAYGYCHDLETNNAQVMAVSRRIVDRDGRRYSDDMVLMTKNAACAIARRNAIFAIVPRAFIAPLEEAAKKVAAGDLNTIRDGRARAVAAFAELGISQTALCEKLERKGVEDLDLEDLALLGGLLTAIKEKETTVADEFPRAAEAPAGAAGSVAETLARRRREQLGAGETEKKPE